ncbi:hypothetical protein ACS0TY_018806 [Phlomoides rotata]
MRLWSFAIIAYRHFSSESAAFDKRNWSSSYHLHNWKKGVIGSRTGTKSKINWTEEQKQVLDAVCNGRSVFITGSAGTGKTFLLQEIIKKLKKIHGRSRVYVTASTGVAACMLEGQTLHSFAGVGLANVDRDALLERVLSNKKACSRWRKVKALVIDEISMIDAELFEGLAHIARILRDKEEDESGVKTWGGIQLIVSGDFFQLPPVRKKTSKKIYAFEADSWSSSFDLLVELTTVFRQSDSLLVRLLQNIRKGGNDVDELKLLEQCCSGYEPDPSAVRLYPRLEDVNKVNKEKLESLNKEIYVYTAQDSGEDKWKRQLKSGIAPDELELCVGARVMLTKNLSPYHKLVNGATGTVLELHRLSYNYQETRDMCSHGNLLPLVKFDSGLELVVEPETWSVVDGEKIVATRRQLPLILSWALSIHKCQGMNLDKLHTNLERVFECGMVYVALSRVRSLRGLHLSGLEPSCIRAHPKVLEFYQGFTGKQNENKF